MCKVKVEKHALSDSTWAVGCMFCFWFVHVCSISARFFVGEMLAYVCIISQTTARVDVLVVFSAILPFNVCLTIFDR